MAEDELSSLLRERQRRAECEAAGIEYVPDTLAVRTPPHCDPAEEPVPDALSGPTALPEQEPDDRILPPPLLVRSPEVTAVCEAGEGSATSAYGESVIELYLDDIAQLTRSELYRIAGSQAALQAALDANLEPLVAESITSEQFDLALISASSMEAAAAAAIRAKALELRGGPDTGDGSTGLYAIAEITALSRLVCIFQSDELWVICDSEAPDGFTVAYEAPVPLPDPDKYRYRPAGFATSTVSVEDANELAVLDAASDPTFSCVYVSEVQVVTCAGDVDEIFDFEYSPPFTTDDGDFNSLVELGAHREFSAPLTPESFVAISPGLSSYALDSLRVQKDLVTVVTITAGHFPSASQADANAKARAWAARQLNCFFPSREAEVNCNNRATAEEGNPVALRMLEATMTEAQVFTEMDSDYAVDPALVTNVALLPIDPGPGAELDTREGLIVKLPAGLVSSLTAQTEADIEARLYALGFLACRWVSPAVECSCDDLWTPEELDEFKAELNTAVSSGTLSFEKGALGSSETGPLSIESSMSLCQASLSCVYCNRTQEPRCSIAYDSEGLPYELWEPATDAGLPISLTTRDGVSTGVTAGLPAGVICDSDPRLVNTLAESTAALPPLLNNEVGAPVCRYGNREISGDCATKVGEWAFALTPDSQDRTLTVAAGSFEAETQVEADELALAFLNASLICEFGNPPMGVLCGATSAVDTVTPAEFETPVTYGHLGDDVADDSIGSNENPLFIEAYAFTSMESPMNAKAQALLSLVTQLDCFWQSAQIELLCGAPPACPIAEQPKDETEIILQGANEDDYCPDSVGDVRGEVLLPPKTVVSYTSQEEANRSAYDLAYGMLDCFWQSARIELMCGAPTRCPVAKADFRETQTINEGTNEDDCCPDSNGDVPGEVFMPAKTVVSYISQADANRQAYDLTFPQLDCFWQSARIDLRCGAEPVCPVGQRNTTEEGSITSGTNAGNCCPNSNGDVLGEVFTAAKAIVSYVSQADANVQAYAITFPQLDCFWENARVDLRCSAPNKMPAGYNDFAEDQIIQEGGITQAPPREPFGVSTYSPASNGYNWGDAVTEASTIISYTSQADANKQAYTLAYAQLDCFWRSPQVILSCLPPRSITQAETLIGEAGLIAYGNEPDTITSDAGMVTSYHNQRDANNQAYGITRAQLRCDGGKDHAFGLSGYATFACCKTKFSQSVVTSNLNKFYSPLPSGTGLDAEPYPGFTEVPLNDLEDVESCGAEVAYFYLEATCGRQYQEDYSEYYSTSAEVKVYGTEQKLVEGVPGAYNIVRRLIARVYQENPDSTLDRAAKDECSGLSIVQLVTSPQKLVSHNMEGNWVPTIIDADAANIPEIIPPRFWLRKVKDSEDTYKAQVQKGLLEWTVTTLVFERIELEVEGRKINNFVEESEIEGVGKLELDLVPDAKGWIDIGWFGDVYAKWTVDRSSGRPQTFTLVGPDEPDVQPIELLNEELVREPSGSESEYGYYVKIGTIPEDAGSPPVQDRTGNVVWDITFVPEAPLSTSSTESSSTPSSSTPSSSTPSSSTPSSNPSSGGPSSGGPSSGGGGNSSGTPKSSNAIVSAPWSPGGYAALATMESNQVLFEFLWRVPVTGRITRHRINSKWLYVCEEGTMTVAAAPNGDKPYPVSASVEGEELVIHAWPLLRPTFVTLKLTGVRRGFADWDMPDRTREQFLANEENLRKMYPQ